MTNKINHELERMKEAIKGKAVLITIPQMYLKDIDAFLKKKNVSRSAFLWKSAIEKIRRVNLCNHPRMRNGDCPEVKCDNCKWGKTHAKTNE